MSMRVLSIAAFAALAIVSSAADAVVTRSESVATPGAATLVGGTDTSAGADRERPSGIVEIDSSGHDRTTLVCRAKAPSPNRRGSEELHGGAVTRAYVATLRERALKGDRDAMFALAHIYHRGTKVPSDYTEALRWYRLAALRGHAEARRTLALILANPATSESIDAAWMHYLASGAPPEVALAILKDRREMLADREPLYGLETLHLETASSSTTTTCEVLQ